MAPPSSPSTGPPEPCSSSANTPVATPSPIPPPVPVETHPNRLRPVSQQKSPDPSRLAPEDALTPPRLRPIVSLDGNVITGTSAAAKTAAVHLRPQVPSDLRSSVAALRQPPAIPPVAARLEQERRAARAARRKTRHLPQVWKKLLWIKHKGYPDNYTDPNTFLEHMQLNPKLRLYDFWSLVADSMVIVQHVSSVLVFVSAYAGIYQDRLNPVAVVWCGTVATVIAWVMWDQWKCEEESSDEVQPLLSGPNTGQIGASFFRYSPATPDDRSSNSSVNEPNRPAAAYAQMNGHANGHANGHVKQGLGLTLSTTNLNAKNAEMHSRTNHGPSLSKSSFQSISPIDPLSEDRPFGSPEDSFSPVNGNILQRITSAASTSAYSYIPHSPTTLPPSVSPRNQARLKTLKSAMLIYFALLGLSPILKSLTKSTSSDSIWALATWLLIINIFFFDYGSQYVPSQIAKKNGDAHLTEPPSSINHSLHTKPSHASISTTASSTVYRHPRPPLSTINSATDFSQVPQPAPFPTLSTASNPTPSPPTATLPPQTTYPSSLSTNAALMASTVLASRLPTTTSVFSLTLFSIQIFGLFPLFRRHLLTRSFHLHTLLSLALITLASAGLGLILSQSYTHTYGNCGYCFRWCIHVIWKSLIGVVVGGAAAVVICGGSAWWLINLQRYKNVVIGPWDPARPMLAGGGRVAD